MLSTMVRTTGSSPTLFGNPTVTNGTPSIADAIAISPDVLFVSTGDRTARPGRDAFPTRSISPAHPINHNPLPNHPIRIICIAFITVAPFWLLASSFWLLP